MRGRRALSGALALSLLSAGSGSAAVIQAELVVPDGAAVAGGGSIAFSFSTRMDDLGNIAFSAIDDETSFQGVYVYDGSEVRALFGPAQSSGFQVAFEPQIAGGVVAYMTWDDEFVARIHRQAVGDASYTVVAHDDTGSPYAAIDPPLINSSGDVFFRATGGGTIRLERDSGGTKTTLVATTGGSTGLKQISTWAVNSLGHVVFEGTHGSSSFAKPGVFLATGVNTYATLIDTDSDFYLFNTADVNDDDTVVFTGMRQDDEAHHVFISRNGAAATPLISADFGFDEIWTVDINNLDQLIVYGTLDDGTEGIFLITDLDHDGTLGDPAFQTLVTVGDEWDGSTIEGMNFELGGLNNTGKLLFTAWLVDGRAGLFVMDVPEPASLALVAFGGLIALTRRR